MKPDETTKHGDCLSDETLTDFLEGTLDAIVQATCEAHLIACDSCRRNLAIYMRVLQPEVTPEEGIDVQNIADVWNQRQPGIAPIPKTGRNTRIAAFAVAAAVLLAVILGPGRSILHWKSPPESAHEVVMALLSRDRPFPSQLSGEPYVALQRSAADGEGVDFKSLSTEMSQRAASQYDLGRFQLIQKNFPDAIRALEDAARDPKATAAVHNDLGVAYMEQRLPDNMIRAEQEFRYALDLDKQFTPAVFNLCLFYVRTNMPEQAKQERDHYLQLDPTSKWADELRLTLTP